MVQLCTSLDYAVFGLVLIVMMMRGDSDTDVWSDDIDNASGGNFWPPVVLKLVGISLTTNGKI